MTSSPKANQIVEEKEELLLKQPESPKYQYSPKQKQSEKKNQSAAATMFSEFNKHDKKERDPEMMEKVNTLLKQMLKKECALISTAIVFSFFGSIQEFTTPYFIGETLNEMVAGNYAQLDKVIIQWICVLLVGAFFSAMRDYMFNIASEKIGKQIRYNFFSSTLKKEIAFYDERKTGDLCKSKYFA